LSAIDSANLPVDIFPENNKLYTAYKNSSIHNLKLDLVGIKEFEATKDGQSYKNRGVCGVGNEAGEHFSAVELTYHRQ
jgi:hypothetical protein